MRYIFFILIILFNCNLTFSQNKYPSLLWEISGNGLTENSYLYGTMHVSEKIAYNLSDLFFDKLLATDAIALETNPEFWLDEMQNSPEYYAMYTNAGSAYNDGFYRQFALQPIQNEDLVNVFRAGNYLVNGILYRNDASQANYQESTYLDMFLYQTGVRSKREIISLENYKESMDLVTQATISNATYTPNSWAKKQLKDKPYYLLLENAYRDKNLDFIDSLNMGINSPEYMELMFYERNNNMVIEMDKIMASKSIFAGVGAAHLPGEGGMIEMLREKGYTVNPLLGDYTQKGKTVKREIESQFTNRKYDVVELPDGILSMPSPSRLYDFSVFGTGILIGLDLPNSSFMNIFRTPTRNYLRKDNYKITASKLDSLHFENIPGKIISKAKISRNGFNGWDIKSETAEGDRQHFMQIVTPLEVITIFMSGKDDFVANKEDAIFSKVKLKEIDNQWEIVKPLQGGFEVKLPNYHTITNNNEYSNLISSPIIEAYDKNDESYYFIVQQTLNDVTYLEETEFELERIAVEFTNQLEIDTVGSKFIHDKTKQFRTSAKLKDGSSIHLKTVQKGSHYYLLGTTAKEKNQDRFFNSFQFTPFNYYKQKVNYVDSVMHFSVKTPLSLDQPKFPVQKREEDINILEGEFLSKVFPSESKQTILVDYQKFHDYTSYPSLDSLWSQRDYSYQTSNTWFKVSSAKNKKENWNTYDVTYSDTLSNQAIKIKYFQNNGVIYTLKTLLDKSYLNDDDFVETFYNSFTPKDTLTGESLFKNKGSGFLMDVNSDVDSIKNSAWKSIQRLDFTNKDFIYIRDLLLNYEFSEDNIKYKSRLIDAFRTMNSKHAQDFLVGYYESEKGNSQIQMNILEVMARSGKVDTYKEMANLMQFDLPLPPSQYEVDNLFDVLGDNINESQVMFSDLFQFYSIPEYKEGVLDYTRTLIDSTDSKSKEIKKVKDVLLANAKLELKRVKSQLTKKTEYYNRYRENQIYRGLKDYIPLMLHFKSDKNVNLFFQDLKTLNDSYINNYLLNEKLRSKTIPTQVEIENALADSNKYYMVYNTFYKNNQLNLIKGKLKNEQIATSRLKELLEFDEEKDNIELFETREASYKEHDYVIFFYKTELKDKNNQTAPVLKTISSIGLEKDEKGNLKPGYIDYSKAIDYYNESEFNQLFKIEVDKILFSDRPRVSFGVANYYGY